MENITFIKAWMEEGIKNLDKQILLLEQATWKSDSELQDVCNKSQTILDLWDKEYNKYYNAFKFLENLKQFVDIKTALDDLKETIDDAKFALSHKLDILNKELDDIINKEHQDTLESGSSPV